MFRRTPFLFFFLLAFRGSECHEGHESDGSCEGNPDVTISAEYRPGVMTLDGHADEWGDVEGFELDLRPALDWDLDKAYPGGGMTVKSLHDGSRVYFLLQVDGEYAYAKNMSKKCPSVALMFQIGENASYHNMGDCKNMPGSCDAKNCRGHEVDLMHFSIGTAIPGRLYGSNSVDNNLGLGSDRFGHLVDLYSWNPHCRYIDGKGTSLGNDSSAQNDWQGSWWTVPYLPTQVSSRKTVHIQQLVKRALITSSFQGLCGPQIGFNKMSNSSLVSQPSSLLRSGIQWMGIHGTVPVTTPSVVTG